MNDRDKMVSWDNKFLLHW